MANVKKKAALLLVVLGVFIAANCFALPTPPATKISIDAYNDPDATGFYLYWQDGQSCDPAQWVDTRRVDVGLPTRSADGLRDEWAIDPAWGLKARDCVQMTAYNSNGDESDFASVEAPGDNTGFFGFTNPKKVKAE